MADEELKRTIEDALRRELFDGPHDLVDVSDGPEDSIHVVVVTRKFEGRRDERETRSDLV